MCRILYTADLHLGDQRVFDKCSRPFTNLKQMEEKIVKNWDEIVNKDDIVYVLGDIAEDSYFNAIEIIRGLKGIKHLIIGNHDLKMLKEIKNSGVFKTIEFMALIEDKGRKVCLCHYPLMDWMEFSRGGYHIYGHVHNKTALNNPAYPEIKAYYQDKLAYNAGVDVTGYKPVTLDEVIKLKEKSKNEPYIN